jgi:hypothetical protein
LVDLLLIAPFAIEYNGKRGNKKKFNQYNRKKGSKKKVNEYNGKRGYKKKVNQYNGKRDNKIFLLPLLPLY